MLGHDFVQPRIEVGRNDDPISVCFELRPARLNIIIELPVLGRGEVRP